jgi:SNF2 family DNA or RNA helicase
MPYELLPKQIPGYNNLVTAKRHLLFYEPGLGKTVVCTKALYDCRPRTVLIVCPKNAIKVWENHICEWFDGLDVANGKAPEDEISFSIWRARGKYNNAAKRKALWRQYNAASDINVYIITYGSFVKDFALLQERHFDCVILDEVRRIRNRKSKAFLELKPICKEAEYVWPLTGTPGFKPEHYWTALHLCEPRYFGSYWNFVETFYVTQMSSWGSKELVAFKNQAAWQDILRRKTSQLTKKDIGHAETIRAAKYVELDECQRGLYKQYEEDMLAVLPDGRLDITSTSLTQVVRFRQLLICPKIIDPSLSVGGALVDLVESIKEEEASPQCVIFTPFTSAFPHFTKYLEEQGYPGVQVLQGGLDPDEQERRIQLWRKSRVPILCSIMYAQAFSLEPASEAYFIGREWVPDDNRQAEERLNRLTTPYAVTANYYIYEDTYDEKQMQILDTKTRQENMIRKVTTNVNTATT